MNLKYVNTKTLLELTGITKLKLERLVREGKITAIEAENKFLIDMDSFNKWLESIPPIEVKRTINEPEDGMQSFNKQMANAKADQSWPRESGQVDKWIFCLTTATLAEDQEIR